MLEFPHTVVLTADPTILPDMRAWLDANMRYQFDVKGGLDYLDRLTLVFGFTSERDFEFFKERWT